MSAGNGRGMEYGGRVEVLLPSSSMVFCRWRHANVLYYRKYVLGRFDDVDIYYIIPRREQIVELIRGKAPEAVFFTIPPMKHGFIVDELVPVIDGVYLYRLAAIEHVPE